MEGKINSDGVLEIKRAGKFKQMKCKPGGMATCGIDDVFLETCDDECPLFGEPEKMDHDDFYRGEIILRLCHSVVLYFKKFTDERIQG